MKAHLRMVETCDAWADRRLFDAARQLDPVHYLREAA